MDYPFKNQTEAICHCRWNIEDRMVTKATKLKKGTTAKHEEHHLKLVTFQFPHNLSFPMLDLQSAKIRISALIARADSCYYSWNEYTYLNEPDCEGNEIEKHSSYSVSSLAICYHTCSTSMCNQECVRSNCWYLSILPATNLPTEANSQFYESNPKGPQFYMEANALYRCYSQ
jgi:hypothetical protein